MNPNMVVMTNPAPGREKAFKEWYCSQHLGDVCATPGVLNGAFHELASTQCSQQWRHMSRYEVDKPFGELAASFGERVKAGLMPLTDTIDGPSVIMLGVTPRGARIEHTKFSGRVATYIIMATPKDGQDEAYNTWYDTQHIPQVLDIPGFLAVQRFDLAPAMGGKDAPFRYMQIYEMDADRIAETLAEAASRAGGPKMAMPGYSKPGSYIGIFTKVC